MDFFSSACDHPMISDVYLKKFAPLISREVKKYHLNSMQNQCNHIDSQRILKQDLELNSSLWLYIRRHSKSLEVGHMYFRYVVNLTSWIQGIILSPLASEMCAFRVDISAECSKPCGYSQESELASVTFPLLLNFRESCLFILQAYQSIHAIYNTIKESLNVWVGKDIKQHLTPCNCTRYFMVLAAMGCGRGWSWKQRTPLLVQGQQYQFIHGDWLPSVWGSKFTRLTI